MKSIHFLSFTLVVLFIFFAGCTDKHTDSYTIEQDMNVPIYQDYESFRSSTKQSPARELTAPGKIYFKDNILFVVEKGEGFHVIDVSDPAAPVNKAFVECPFCVDLVVRNGTSCSA